MMLLEDELAVLRSLRALGDDATAKEIAAHIGSDSAAVAGVLIRLRTAGAVASSEEVPASWLTTDAGKEVRYPMRDNHYLAPETVKELKDA